MDTGILVGQEVRDVIMEGIVLRERRELFTPLLVVHSSSNVVVKTYKISESKEFEITIYNLTNYGNKPWMFKRLL